MDTLLIPGHISVGILAMAVVQIKDVEKGNKLFLGQCAIFYVIVAFVTTWL